MRTVLTGWLKLEAQRHCKLMELHVAETSMSAMTASTPSICNPAHALADQAHALVADFAHAAVPAASADQPVGERPSGHHKAEGVPGSS